MIGLEASWVEDWKKTQQGAATGNAGEPSNLLAPLAKMLESRGPRGSLSAAATRALLDSVGSRLDEARDISRYLIGLMVFLGLLGRSAERRVGQECVSQCRSRWSAAH